MSNSKQGRFIGLYDYILRATPTTNYYLKWDGTKAVWADVSSGLAFDGSTANGVCTYKDADEISVESTLTYDGSTGRLIIGEDDDAIYRLQRKAHSDGNGGILEIIGGDATDGQIDKAGGSIVLYAGRGTGNQFGGNIDFYSTNRGGSGTTLNTSTKLMSIEPTTGETYVTIYEKSGLSDDDYFQIKVAEHGATTLLTRDTAAMAADLTIDVDGDIELNAEGGDIDFKDGSAQLAKISTDGLSFENNTGAGVIFDGSSNDANLTTLSVIDPTAARAINLPDASGTVQLQGENTGQVVHVNIKDPNSYLFYAYNDDSWYSAGSGTLAILGSSTAPSSISSANSEYQGRVASYTAIAACTVKKLIFTFYWSSSVVNSADIDWGFSKFTPIDDGTAASITMNAITATDHNGSYTEVKPYQKTFTFSGGNADLAAGDCFAFHARTTGGQSAQRVLLYGSAVLSVEIR